MIPSETVRPENSRAQVLVDAGDLAARLLAGEPVVLLDVRWVLGDPHGREHHAAGHLPGAVFVDLPGELSGEPGPTVGRHPLPTVADLQAAARRWGVRTGSTVVIYDDSGSLAAARAWWLLRWAGFDEVRLLDGGLGAWVLGGGVLESGEVVPAAGDVVLSSGHLAVLDADGAAALVTTGVLLDARSGERYRGEAEPVDPRAGHVPGAVSAPTAENLTSAGKFRPSDELRARFATLREEGADVGVYCGSGVTAAHQVVALAAVGVDAALYVGSWSQWSADPARPVATG